MAVLSTAIVTGSEAGHILTCVVPVPRGIGLPCCPTVCLAPMETPTVPLHEHEQQLPNFFIFNPKSKHISNLTCF
jgi:hypothetical protein